MKLGCKQERELKNLKEKREALELELQRAEELKRNARKAMELEWWRAEEELREVEEETEASLRERQRELELAEVEAKAWEEVERDPIELEVSLSTNLSSVSNIVASMYAEPGPSTRRPDDAARTQPNPDPEEHVTVNRCPASVSRQSKMVPPSMLSLNASFPTSCSQEAVAVPSSVVAGELSNNVFASQVSDVPRTDNSLPLFQREKQESQPGTTKRNASSKEANFGPTQTPQNLGVLSEPSWPNQQFYPQNLGNRTTRQ